MSTRVLVVEDDEPLRNFVVAALTHEGYETCVAADGTSASAALAAAPADLVITDLVMPGEDGFALLRRLPRWPAGPRVIAMTGLTVDSRFYLNTAELLGAAGTLPKPFTREQLLSQVDRVLHPPERE